jgi:hypothetical protein
MPGGLAARGAVSVVLVHAHALRVTLKDGPAEALFVLGVVAALPCAAALLLRLAAVGVALGVLGVLRAAGDRADPPALGLGHRDLLSYRGALQLKGVAVAGEGRSDWALGVFAAGLVLVFVAVIKGWWLLLVPAACLIVGAVAGTTRARRSGQAPEVTVRPGGDGRPWRRQR